MLFRAQAEAVLLKRKDVTKRKCSVTTAMESAPSRVGWMRDGDGQPFGVAAVGGWWGLGG